MPPGSAARSSRASGEFRGGPDAGCGVTPGRAPTPAILPRGSVSLEELQARWDRTRQGYATALSTFGPADLVRPMMKHPIVGKLTPLQTLTFLETHLAHHGRQIDRIQKSSSASATMMPAGPRM